MRRVTINGLLAHKLRLALTSLAIVLGVTFVSGTFVLTDTLHNLVSGLIGSVYQDIDFQVRGVAEFPSKDAASAVRNPLPESLLDVVRRVPGVAAADGEVGGYAQFLSAKGTPLSTGGAPTDGQNFDPDHRTSEFHIVQGRPPTQMQDVAMDAGTAKKYGFHVGQHVRVLFANSVGTFTLTGTAALGSANNLAGTSVALFTLPTAQRVFGEMRQLDHINVVAQPGADKAAVRRAISRALPPGAELVTSQTLINEATSSVNKNLSLFSTALLVFAFISLFVGAFTIFNTFSITVGQRTRELALLRIVGASRRQILGSVLGEAAIVGIVSSIVGTGLGVLTAIGLQALLRAFGITLPSGPLVFEARTVIVAVAVGVGVTLVSAVSPARRAVRIPPVAAISDRQAADGGTSRRRMATGMAVGVVSAVLLGAGLAAPVLGLVGLGAAGIFVAAAMLAPVFARPVSSFLGRPFARLRGAPGKLGRANSMRNPGRTAQTASALMIGIALVSAMAVFGASLSKSATSAVNDAVSADLIVSGTGSGPGSFSPALASALSRLPGVAASATVYGGQFEIRRSVESLGALSTNDLAATVILHMTSGTSAALARGDLLIDSPTAKSDHLAVGSRVPVKFALTGPAVMHVGGIFKANALIGSYLVSSGFFRAHFSDPTPGAVLLSSAHPRLLQRDVKRLINPYPTVQSQTRSQFEQAQIASVNKLLGLVYALLALAVLIALVGIVNTLMLSVFERTREIGLLRAVGMKRRQVRSMIRTESVILSIFGAVIGIVIGTAMGIALVPALKLSDMAVPGSSLVVFLVLSAALGFVAASWPARRASKLDVLAAIATE